MESFIRIPLREKLRPQAQFLAMRLAKARLLASLATTESDFLFILKIKMTAHSSKRKSSQLATFTRKVRDLGSNFRHEIRFAKLLPSFTTILAVIFFYLLTLFVLLLDTL